MHSGVPFVSNVSRRTVRIFAAMFCAALRHRPSYKRYLFGLVWTVSSSRRYAIYKNHRDKYQQLQEGTKVGASLGPAR